MSCRWAAVGAAGESGNRTNASSAQLYTWRQVAVIGAKSVSAVSAIHVRAAVEKDYEPPCTALQALEDLARLSRQTSLRCDSLLPLRVVVVLVNDCVLNQ